MRFKQLEALNLFMTHLLFLIWRFRMKIKMLFVGKYRINDQIRTVGFEFKLCLLF